MPAAIEAAKPTLAEMDKTHREEFSKKTPEQIAEDQKEFLKAFDFGEPKKEEAAPADKPADKAADKPAAPEEKKEEKPAEAKPEEPKDEKVEPKPTALVDDGPTSRQPIDPTGIVIDDPELKVEPAKPQEPEVQIEYEEEDLRQIEQAEWLARNDPRFKGRDLKKELTTFWKKEEEFARKWEKENEGEEFDPAAKEHAEFYRKNGVRITPADFSKAQEGVIEDRATARATAESDRRISEIEGRQLVEKAKPIIERRSKEAVAKLVEKVLPGTLKDGAKVLTREIYDEIAKKDPAAVQFLDDEAAVLKSQIRALESLVAFGTADFEARETSPDGRGFFPASDVAQAGIDLESRIMAMPEEKRVEDGTGRKFAPRAAYNAKYKEIVSSTLSDDEKKRKIATLNNKVWTIHPEDIGDFLVSQSANRVKKVLSRIPRSTQVTDKKDESAKPASEQKPAADQTKAASPSLTTSSDNVDTSALNKNKGDENKRIIDKAFWQ